MGFGLTYKNIIFNKLFWIFFYFFNLFFFFFLHFLTFYKQNNLIQSNLQINLVRNEIADT